jgi:hypothetical protein
MANAMLIIDRIVVSKIEESDLGCSAFLIAMRQSRDVDSDAYQICLGVYLLLFAG